MPAAPVTTRARATRRSSRRATSVSAARDTGLRARRPPRPSPDAAGGPAERHRADPQRRRAHDDGAPRRPASPPAVAVTVPLPSTRPALNVTAPPVSRTNVPSDAGATLHVDACGSRVSERVRQRGRERRLAARPQLARRRRHRDARSGAGHDGQLARGLRSCPAPLPSASLARRACRGSRRPRPSQARRARSACSSTARPGSSRTRRPGELERSVTATGRETADASDS